MNKNVLSEYKIYLLKELNVSNNTIISYERDINEYLEYLGNNHINYLKINRDNVINYLKFLDVKKLKNSTISRKISSIRGFYDFLKEKELIDVNIFKQIKNPKLERKLPNYLSYEEMRVILNSLDIKKDEGLYKRLIVELFYATGVRVSELANIKIFDINRNEKTIRIFGKGRKERIVYYGEYASEMLDLYLNRIRNKLNYKN